MAIIQYESKDGIAIITINRPEAKNALNNAACQELHAAWERFASAGEDRVAVLTGAGKDFCAGADTRDLPQDIFQCMPNLTVPCDKPIIVAVSGWVIGAGSSMLMLSDIAVASSDARIIYPEAKVGGFAGIMGGFPSRMPPKIGMQWTLTGDALDVQRAYEIGFINEICEPGAQLERALAIAARIAGNAPLVVKGLKALARATMPKGPVETAMAHTLMLKEILHSEDMREGFSAVNQKRKPVFVGR